MMGYTLFSCELPCIMSTTYFWYFAYIYVTVDKVRFLQKAYLRETDNTWKENLLSV